MKDKTEGHPPTSATEPLLGSPALRQRHSLHAPSLETSPPEVKPTPKRVHHLEPGDSTARKKRRGRRHKLPPAQRPELQAKLEGEMLGQPKRIRKVAIKKVREILGDGTKISDRTINRQIVSPVLKKLKTSKK